jgi:hypothetical protein
VNSLEKMNTGSTKFQNVAGTFLKAESVITGLHQSSVFAPYLRSSKTLSWELTQLLATQTKDFNLEKEISFYSMYSIQSKAAEYKIALIAELGSLDSYFVTRKGAFDTHYLLNSGEVVFPQDLVKKVPEALFDAREAAKSLAYELPTAAGFHIFRATESVVRKYYYHVTGGSAAPRVRNLGVYLNALKQAQKGEPKVLGALKQMIDLHRNPLIHPEAVLTMDEAISILGIGQSVMTAMLTVLPEVPPTTVTTQPSLPT